MKKRFCALVLSVVVLLSSLPVLAAVSSGVRTIVLTVAISLGAALLFPVAEDQERDTSEEVSP